MAEEVFSTVNITDKSFRETKICLNKLKKELNTHFSSKV